MIEKENLEKNTIRKKYGWFPKISILEDLKDQYQDFLDRRQKRENWYRLILSRITGHAAVIKWGEILLFFGFSEILHRVLGNSVQFRYIDVRLLYVVIIATVYKGNIIKNLIMDCQSYAKYRPNETTGGIFVSWRRKEELPTGA